MDRLELVPEGVRGAGNIMDYSPDLRVDGDVSVSGCGLTQFSSEIFGFVLDYYLMSGDGLTVELLAPRFVSLDTVSVPVTVNVTGTCTGVVCELVSVSDGTVLFTESGTVSGGSVLFNVPVPDGVERECCWRVRVNSSSGGVTRSMGVVFIDGLSELVLTGSDDVVQLDEGIFLFASLFDGDGIGVGGVPVYFYEVYEITSIDITGDKSIIQSGESVDVSAKLKDEDGSLIEGETVHFYTIGDFYAKYPTIDEGDNIVRLALPSKFKIEFDLEVVGDSSPSNAFLRFNSSNGPYCGKGSSSSNNISFGSDVLTQINDDEKITCTLEYDGTSVVFSSPPHSITIDNATFWSLYSLSRNGDTIISNIVIYDLSEG